MSKRSRTLRKARQALSGRATTRVRSPADLLALLPYLLGFTPADSLVLVSLESGGRRVGPVMRLDLPEATGREPWVDHLCRLARSHGLVDVVVAVFCADERVADPVARLTLDRLTAQRIHVVDAFRGDGQRWWSYVCDNPSCCPARGTAYDADASPAAVDAVLAGLTKVPDREALRERFAPAREEARAAVEAEVRRLGGSAAATLTPAQVRAVVPRVLAGAVREPSEVARLLLSLRDTPQRDEVWSLMTHEDAGRHLEGWRELMRLAPDELLAPVGSLAAFAAWLGGHGALASHAVDRVLEVSPDYRMALLVRTALESALDPRTWRSWTG